MKNQPKPVPTPHRSIVMMCCMILAAMVALTAASVPLYQLFCKVTGYNGTPTVAKAAPLEAGKKHYTIRFNADISNQLDWSFKPSQHTMDVLSGKSSLAFFEAENRSDKTITGTATFNVVPEIAGKYFSKIQCFCFNKQTLHPGQKISLPVTFFVDPAIENDANLKQVKTITLSYTFFRVKDKEKSMSNN